MQKKDYDAVGVLFDRYARLFRGIAYRILGDRSEAEDMVQEIFLPLCRKANTFDPAKGSARTWMVQFAHRRSEGRKARTSPTRECKINGELGTAGGTLCLSSSRFQFVEGPLPR